MQQHIKNIIFDLGNVIIDLDIPRTEQKFQALLAEEFEDSFAKSHAADIFNRYEVGAFSEEEFVRLLQETTGQYLAPQAIIDAWNGMLLGIPPQRFELLQRLQADYQLYLLSNTNATHLDWVDTHLQSEYDMTIQEFDEQYFVKPYYSHLINLRKPNTEVYEFVLADAGLEASETLFIDDNADNIEGAKQVGLHTILHRIGDEVAEVLKDF